MPQAASNLHMAMYAQFCHRRFWRRLRQAVKAFHSAWVNGGIYGLQWGDPDVVPPLTWVRDNFLLPYVNPETVGIEIGPGGGRWTRYLLPCKKLFLVDCVPEVLAEAQRRFRRFKHVEFILNGGYDFPGIPDTCATFVFSFGTFVHLEIEIIRKYLESLRRVLAPSAQVVLQYADQTKILAQRNAGFAKTKPDDIRGALLSAGFRIFEEDTTSLWHSSLVRFGP